MEAYFLICMAGKHMLLAESLSWWPGLYKIESAGENKINQLLKSAMASSMVFFFQLQLAKLSFHEILNTELSWMLKIQLT